MIQDLLSGVQSAIRDGFQHVANADMLTLALVVLGIAVVGYLLLRR